MTDTPQNTTTTEHTPGPWDIFEDGFDILILAEDTSGICKVGIDLLAGKASSNARLIAAAPDLLAACKLLVSWYDDDTDSSKLTHGIDQARAAISKAEGHDR